MQAVSSRLGLTGGIGSGKSTVAGFFKQLGASIIDADAISRATTAPGGSAIAALTAVFGVGLLTTDGALDRVQMRELIYSDPTAKARLESIVHPLVGRAIEQLASRAEGEGAECIVFDIPLLVESNHWRTALDRVLVIDCAEATQINRVTARNGLARQDVERILASQVTRLQRLAAADCVLFNDKITLDDLRQQVVQIGNKFGL